ncbi:MAG: protein kinase [Myxococcaceae bacterium]|nr:protein kinase [Myxococcaceae bacterium]
MAELFLAQEPPTPGLVVLKRILPYLSEEPEFVQMFLDEARIAAQLHHPNIVQVYELGKLDNTIFIAMEFVEGIDLRRVVQEEGKFGANVPYGVAAAICAQVAAGLDYAHHSKGVDGRPLELIHRDVSPQNVMIGYDGRVKIVDFGIAKAGALVNRSKPGVIKGKFLYLAPEQVAQEKLDHRADLFALGTMMYEITTGKSPFAKPTTEGILYAIRSEDPSPPHLLKDDYPTDLSRIIMRCLVKDRNLRYQRASEVQADLEVFLNSGALRQSTNIAEYVARLMGEEEERTVLHIPIAVPKRKEATQTMSPGLAARPMRRATGEGEASPPGFSSEPEPPTQMARPLELLASVPATAEDKAVREIDQTKEVIEDRVERTAVGRAPGYKRTKSGESTVHQRGRGSGGSPRRPTPISDPDTEPRARRPQAPPSRRPLISEGAEEDDDSGQSISLTQPTMSQRRRPAPEEEDEGEDYDGASVSVTPPTTGQRRRLVDEASAYSVTESSTGNRRRLADEPPPSSDSMTQPTGGPQGSRPFDRLVDPEEDLPLDTESELSELDEMDDSDPTEGYTADQDDDESTTGYENEGQGSTLKSRGFILVLIAVGAVVLFLLGVSLFWAVSASLDEPEEPGLGAALALAQIDPQRATEDGLPADTEPSPETPPANTPEEAPSIAPEAVAAADPSPAPVEPEDSAGAEPLAAASSDNLAGPSAETQGGSATPEGSAPPAARTEPAPAPARPLEGATGGSVATVEATKAEPQLVEVVFRTSSPTLVRVNGRKVELNKVLYFAPGKITLEWWCPPKRKRDGSDIKRLRLGKKEIYPIHCARKASR